MVSHFFLFFCFPIHIFKSVRCPIRDRYSLSPHAMVIATQYFFGRCIINRQCPLNDAIFLDVGFIPSY